MRSTPRHLRASVALLGLLLLTSPALASEETWPFEPEKDAFSKRALLDLRLLNEREAGENGWIRVDREGDFLRGDGKPIRFWAVNTGVDRGAWQPRPRWPGEGRPDLAYHARWLAKRGVNMVRCHSHINPDPASQNIDDVNRSECEWIWKTVGAMAKEGIYTTVSPYWANTMKSDDAKWGTTWKGQHHGLLFFDATLQKAYKAWLETLFTTRSKHLGGRTLAQHPGLAIFQIQNEDSLLFWTVNNIKGVPARELGKRFGAWATRRYGSLDKAYRVWGDAWSENDDRAAGVVAMMNVWNLTRDGRAKAPVTPRHADQLRFWTELMRDFNREIARYIAEDLECPVLVNAGNWKTADTILLEDAERYSYAVNDVIAVNRYFSGLHIGAHRGWAIVNGDRYTSKTALGAGALDFPLNVKQVAGRPLIVTESTWVFPDENAFESPLMVAAYSALTGIDAYYWFATGTNDWTPPRSANGYMPSQTKWLCMTPDMAGQWPAAAYLFRKGLVKRGKPVVQEHRSLDAIYGGKTPVIAESASFDPNRDAGDLPARSALESGITPWAFLAGPVTVTYDSSEAKSKAAKLDRLVTRTEGGVSVRSITDELLLDTGARRLTVNAPGCQAVSGHFPTEEKVELEDVALTVGPGAASVIVVALDDKPIRTSSRILVQVGSRCRPTGWATKPVTIRPRGGRPVEGQEVTSYGRAPWRVRSVPGRLAIRNGAVRKAVVLDMNGMERERAKVERRGGRLSMALPRDAMYVLLIK